MLNLYLYTLLGFVSIIIPVLIAVAFTTLIERKVMAAMQNRRGPNVMGFYGLYQPISDGFKLLIKEPLVPYQANKIIFIFSPILVLVLSFMSWSIVPIAEKTNIINIDTGVLFLLGISSINVYGILLAGWASNSKYAFVGGLRAAAQMISYEVSLSLSILPVVLLSGDMNLTEIVYQQRFFWFVFPLFPSAVIFLISALAETNRTPFDLPEAEGELVAGFNVEYSGFGFALFFLAEYANIFINVSVICYIFFGWLVCRNNFLVWVFYNKNGYCIIFFCVGTCNCTTLSI
jgi:NADH-quinone oxidoreductase subunit H